MSQNRQDGDGEALSVTDPEDYNTQRRLQQLHAAREQFPQIRREAREQYNPTDPRATDLTEQGYYEKVANALLDYLQEVEPVVVSLRDDHDAKAMWEDQPVDDDEDTPDLTLADILEQSGQRLNENDEDVPISREMSRKGYRQANKFLSEVGLGLSLGSGGLPMLTDFDASRDDVEPGVTNVDMDDEPDL